MTALPRRTPIHHRPHRAVTTLALAALIVLAGGCASHSTTPPLAAATSAAPSNAPAQTGAPSQAPTTTTDPSSAPGATGAGSGDACRLVTVADVSTAVGQPMTQQNPGPSPVCSYSNADVTKQLIIAEYADRNAAALQSILPLEGQAEHIDGLGDDAFWEAPIGMMYVRRGDRSFTISTSVDLSDPAAWKAAMVQLATTALANL